MKLKELIAKIYSVEELNILRDEDTCMRLIYTGYAKDYKFSEIAKTINDYEVTSIFTRSGILSIFIKESKEED